MPREIRTYDFLDELGIAYQRTDHEPTDNMEACNAIDAVLGVILCKNLFLCNLSGKISKRVKKQTLRLLKRKDAVGWEILS